MKDTSKKAAHILFLSQYHYYAMDVADVQKYTRFDECLSGDIFGVIDDKAFCNKKLGRFTLVAMYMKNEYIYKGPYRTIFFLFFSIFMAFYRHFFVQKYDVIVTREPIFSGLIATFLRLFMRVKVVHEMNGNYASDYVWGNGPLSVLKKLKKKYVCKIMPKFLRHADGIKLLYPQQLEPYAIENLQAKVYTFQEYTPVSDFVKSDVSDNYILSLGFPYDIKGYDILIEAFNLISSDFPDAELHLVGYMTEEDKRVLNGIRNNNEAVKLLAPLEFPDAMNKLSRCKVFALASRTEGMGRVLLEAMAHGKCLVASAVDGIPHYVKDDDNGLLFEKENVQQLADCLVRVLSDDALRQRLGDSGRKHIEGVFSEESYFSNYMDMIQDQL